MLPKKGAAPRVFYIHNNPNRPVYSVNISLRSLALIFGISLINNYRIHRTLGNKTPSAVEYEYYEK